MFEHVGRAQLDTYFDVVHAAVAPGRAVPQPRHHAHASAAAARPDVHRPLRVPRRRAASRSPTSRRARGARLRDPRRRVAARALRAHAAALGRQPRGAAATRPSPRSARSASASGGSTCSARRRASRSARSASTRRSPRAPARACAAARPLRPAALGSPRRSGVGEAGRLRPCLDSTSPRPSSSTTPSDPEGFRAGMFRFGKQLGAKETGIDVYELPPGQAICPYHYEYGEEEWLLVLEGRPTLRTPEGEEEIGPWEMVFFPTGPDGAHSVRNKTDETVRVLMFSTRDRARRRGLSRQRQDRHLHGQQGRRRDGAQGERASTTGTARRTTEASSRLRRPARAGTGRCA